MLQEFFITCSGADADVLATCSKSENTKYVGIGATVFFTAVMALLASAFALFTVFNNVPIATAFGIVWALLIFNLDRFIVSTIKKKNSIKQEFLQAIPRLILAIIIALVISKPLEIRIFEKEINTELLKERNAMTAANKRDVSLYYKNDLSKNEEEVTRLKNSIKTKEKQVNALYEAYIAEAEGSMGTKKMGKGPIYKEKREAHDAALKEFTTFKEITLKEIEKKEKKGESIQKDLDKRVSDNQPIINNFDGLMARITALGKLPWMPSFFIMLLFLSIETAPIFTKLLTPKGEYDVKIEDRELVLQMNIDYLKKQRDVQWKTDMDLYNRAHEKVSTDAQLLEYKIKNTKEIIKKLTDAFTEQQIKDL